MVFQNFNPRAHEGYDHDFFTNEKLPFNSFNPRTHGGYDGVAPRNCNQQPRVVKIDLILCIKAWVCLALTDTH